MINVHYAKSKSCCWSFLFCSFFRMVQNKKNKILVFGCVRKEKRTTRMTTIPLARRDFCVAQHFLCFSLSSILHTQCSSELHTNNIIALLTGQALRKKILKPSRLASGTVLNHFSLSPCGQMLMDKSCCTVARLTFLGRKANCSQASLCNGYCENCIIFK